MLNRLHNLYIGAWSMAGYPTKTMEEIQEILWKNNIYLQIIENKFQQIKHAVNPESKPSSTLSNTDYFLSKKELETEFFGEQAMQIVIDPSKSLLSNQSLLSDDSATNPHSIKNKIKSITEPALAKIKSDMTRLITYQNDVILPKDYVQLCDLGSDIATTLHDTANKIRGEIKWHCYIMVMIFKLDPKYDTAIDRAADLIIKKMNNKETLPEPQLKLIARTSGSSDSVIMKAELKKEIDSALTTNFEEKTNATIALKVTEYCVALDTVCSQAISALTKLQNRLATQLKITLTDKILEEKPETPAPSKKIASSTSSMLHALVETAPVTSAPTAPVSTPPDSKLESKEMKVEAKSQPVPAPLVETPILCAIRPGH